MFKKKILYTALSLLAVTSFCQAGTLTVVNELKRPFKIKFEPQAAGDAHLIKEAAIFKDISEPIQEIEITFPQLSGNISYAIRAADLIGYNPKPEEKCLNLNVEKDYKVTFKEVATKIACIVEEIHQDKYK